MPFFNEKTGALTLLEGYSLSGRMPEDQVFSVCRSAGGDQGVAGCSVVPFPPLFVMEERLALTAFLEKKALRAVEISPLRPGAQWQRAFLCQLFHLKDPCPDTLKPCRFSCDFGSLTLSTDPRTGLAIARISYSKQPG